MINTQPFSSFAGKTNSQVWSSLDRYRRELEMADNGPADRDAHRDVVELNCGDTTLTAKLNQPSKVGVSRFSTHYQSPEGVALNIVDERGCSKSITSVSRSCAGTYTGTVTTCSAITNCQMKAEVTNLEAPEAEFYFMTSGPALKPTKA